ncbi:uncharacterized protein [Nicotiana sylvestris]|uniref:uncharacterized protein n=1 Tax=Nicotiana sylvestris TaxID=4096 RepID=UPI00388C9731
MAEKEARLKTIANISNNLLNSLSESGREHTENTTPRVTPEGEISPPTHRDLTILREKGASTSTGGEAAPAVKKLLEEWLTSTLRNMLEKPPQGNVEDSPPTEIAATTNEPSATRTGNTRTVTDAGDDALMAILKKMEEMENENKTLRDQMKEHQERVDKIPGTPKLLPKRDVSRFVEQPYNDGATPYPIPKTFKMPPYLKIYDGTTDSEDHLIHYVTAVKGNNLSKEQVPSVPLKRFGKTLTGGALTWYSQLPARSISTFEEMADKFATAHAGVKKAEARVNDIFAIRQTAGEGLWDFLARFNRVRMSLPNMSKEMAVAAFQNGLNRNGSNTTKKMLKIVYTLEKLGTKVQWLQKMKSDPSTKRSSILCEFHQEKGHKTEDCIGLRQEVVRMLNQGYLKELLSDKGSANFARGCDPSQGPPKPPSPARTIQMIIGGGDDMVINHVKFTTMHKLKRTVAHEWYDDLEDSIIFDKSDADGLSFPHYDALVITLRIADIDVKQIMVDDGSSACIVHPRVLMQMRLEDKIIPRCITLTGFNNAVERTSGEIVLPVLVGEVTLETTFHVMNQETAYNAIIGRPWIHAMRAVPSSFYQVIKFPTSWGIFSIQGEPRTAQECYRIARDCTHTNQLK